MKRNVKSMIMVAICAVLLTGTLSAHPNGTPDSHKNAKQHERYDGHKKPGYHQKSEHIRKDAPAMPAPAFNWNKQFGFNSSCEENLVIGTVKSVDEVGSKIVVVLPDSKEVTVAITAFTHFAGIKEQKIAEIKKDAEVLITIYKTDSKIPVAAFVAVKTK
ncbi:MAG: hypothetical protein MJ188_01560 [Treponema sp.]|nr:hypothetical protein [Treponema sp.]